MKAINYSKFREFLKAYCDDVCDNNEMIIITRKQGRNVVLLNIDKFNELMNGTIDPEFLKKVKAHDSDPIVRVNKEQAPVVEVQSQEIEKEVQKPIEEKVQVIKEETPVVEPAPAPKKKKKFDFFD